MPAAKRNLRGLRNIKTLSGRAAEAARPHRAYIKLACLEMERERRVLERKNAVRRLASIDALLRAIQAEEAALRRGLGSAADAPDPSTCAREAAPGRARRKMYPFKVKY
jgi:hypothetical protein